jgi:hypothetical protein
MVRRSGKSDLSETDDTAVYVGPAGNRKLRYKYHRAANVVRKGIQAEETGENGQQ